MINQSGVMGGVCRESSLQLVSVLATDQSAGRIGVARDQCQSAAVTPRVNLSFSFQSRVSRHFIDFIAMDSQQLV